MATKRKTRKRPKRGAYKRPAKDGTRSGRNPLIECPKVWKALIDAVEDGMPYWQAGVIAGISKTTIYRYLEKAEDPNEHEVYREFRDELEHARLRGNHTLVQEMRKDRDWRAKAHLLSVRDRDTWAKKHHLELTGKDDAPVGVQIMLPELEPEDAIDALQDENAALRAELEELRGRLADDGE